MRIEQEADASQESADYPVLPPGDYICEVVQVEDGITAEKKLPKVTLIFSVMTLDGRNLGKVFHTLTFIPKGQPGHGIWLRANHSLGLPFDGGVSFDTADYLHKFTRARIDIETYQGRQRNKITKFYVNEDPVQMALDADKNGQDKPKNSSSPGQQSEMGF